ncbi:hypothetical protein [Streptomyces niveus]|uniref:hypothetical protein n=1 Tax=Streptomyces niveus TaxID=193462 RepID=UPI00341C7C27
MRIDFVHLATPNTMTADAYREFCWGASLSEAPAGYGVLIGHRDDGSTCTAVLEDVEYARLLVQSTGGINVPRDKVTTVLDGWPNMRSDADSVWD